VASVGLLPALSLVAGVVAGLAWPWTSGALLVPAVALLLLAAVGYVRGWRHVTVAALVAGFAACGAANAAHARDQALDTPLRRLLDAEFGGFALAELGPGGRHDPVLVRARILEDAAARDGYVSVHLELFELQLRGRWRATTGGVRLSVSGSASADAVDAWRAGRTIEAPIVFRRPARYLNEGVPDFERDLALDGTTLLGSVKSGLLVEVVARGRWLDEVAAAARARVRQAVTRWIGTRNATSAAVVIAVLIGDRAAMSDEVRERLQASGTYHVIAISGGNIAVFVVLVALLCALSGLGPRPAAVVTIAVLAAYAAVVVSGPSVRRAVFVAGLYLAARAVDHRAPAWHAAAVACAGLSLVWPLDLLDVGFVLTFGAAAALLGTSVMVRRIPAPWPMRWLVHAAAASVAVEAMLLPVQATAFARVALAGVVLNLAAVPLMTVAQLAGLAVTALDVCGFSAWAPAWVAERSVTALLQSATLAELAPWLAPRTPPPAFAWTVAHYVALAALMQGRTLVRVVAACAVAATAAVIVTGAPIASAPGARGQGNALRVTLFDVGQAEAVLVEPPAGAPLLVDSGGTAFGSGIDIATRVLVPALWARRVRSLGLLLLTHGDPDHMGGASGVLASVAVSEAWLGIRVPRHAPGEAWLADLIRRGVPHRYVRAGQTFERGGLTLHVLHPSEPDWERPRVRNDDSVVVEAVHGDVAFLFTGDITAEVERQILPRLTWARTRVLKVAHHGSRTSTGQALLDGWRPHLALISAGRGNSFGHPAPDVVRRLEAAGARVLRTDRDGQITVTTNGDTVSFETRRSGATSDVGRPKP
jgi:competence protein ComEC